jgi:hypothetical protein
VTAKGRRNGAAENHEENGEPQDFGHVVSMNAFVQIYYHARCALRRPAHWRWHLAGVRRALTA